MGELKGGDEPSVDEGLGSRCGGCGMSKVC